MRPTDSIHFHIGKVLEAIEASTTSSKQDRKPPGPPPHTLQLRLPPEARQVLVFVIAENIEPVAADNTLTEQPKSCDNNARVCIVKQQGELANSTVFVIDHWADTVVNDTVNAVGTNTDKRLDMMVVDVTEELVLLPITTDDLGNVREVQTICDDVDTDSSSSIENTNADSDGENVVALTVKAGKQSPNRNVACKKRKQICTFPVKCQKCRTEFCSASEFNFHCCQKGKDENNFNYELCGEKVNAINKLCGEGHDHKENKCAECLRIFETHQVLEEHRKKYNHRSHFQYRVCEEGFISHSHFRKHKPTIDRRKLACELCAEFFANKEELNSHCASAHAILHQCSLCKESFVDEAILLKHRLDAHATQAHKCDICNRIFMQKLFLEEHMKEHFVQASLCVTSHEQAEIMTSADLTEIKKNTAGDENSFACKNCDALFLCESDLQSHSKCHNDRLFPCNQCNRTMQTEEELLQHQQRHEAKFICEQCGRRYLRMCELRKHMTTHSEERPFPCMICGFRFYTESRLRVHQRVHGEKHFLCHLCPMKFTDHQHLQRHLASHTGTNRQRVSSCVFHCSICAATFESPARLVQHYDSAHPVSKFTCTECNISVESFDLLKLHFRTQHVGKIVHCCRVCGDAFHSRHLLESHRLSNHKVPQRRQIVADTTVTCSTCQKVFTSSKLYQVHLTDTRCQESAKKQLQSTSIKCLSCHEEFPTSSHHATHNAVHGAKFPFPCHVCGKSLADSSEVTDHIGRHVAIGLWSCVECKKVLSTRQCLRLHMANHGVASPFTCLLCKRTFNSRGALATHSNVHTGEHPFRCNRKDCDASFQLPNQLKTHLLAHDGRKTYECAECSKLFWVRSALVSHLKSHISKQDSSPSTFDCNICRKTFNRKANLVNHLRSHSGEKGLLRKQFACKRCKSMFTTQAHLIIHEQTHDGVGLVCPVCQRKFKTMNWLQMHMRIHTSESPECPICHKRFTIQRSLEEHMAVHGNQGIVIECPKCHAKFKSEQSYLKHDAKCHSGFSGQVCRLCGLGFATIENYSVHVKDCDYKKNRRTTKNFTCSSEMKSEHGIMHDSMPQDECIMSARETGTSEAQDSVVMIQSMFEVIDKEESVLVSQGGPVGFEQLIESQVPNELLVDGSQENMHVQLVFESS